MKFADIPGNEGLKSRMRGQIISEKIPQAQLIVDRGSGTGLALARAYAQYVMCLDRGESESCGTCSSCIKVSRMIHPDLHFSFPAYRLKSGEASNSADFMEIWRRNLEKNPFINYNQWMQAIDGTAKQTQISKQECRQMISRLGLKTFESRYKLQIIWLAEFLGDAGNVLLKGLEEPTEHTHFLLVAEVAERILPTIRSRTQMVQVQPLGDEIIRTALKEQHGMDDSTAAKLAFLADGHYGTALELMASDNAEDVLLFEKWLGLISRRELIPVMDFTDEISSRKKEWIRHFLLGTLSYIRECTLFHYNEQYTMRIPGGSDGFRERFARFIDHGVSDAIQKAINSSLYHIERNANLKIELFDLSLTLREIVLKHNRSRKAAESR